LLTDIGEYIVGAYLQLELDCDVVDYNIRPPGGGLEGLEELDVIGINFKSNTAYLCEVTTHIRGLLYVNNQTTVDRIRKKHERQKRYGEKFLKQFTCQYMFWSPVVPTGFITENLNQLPDLKLVINGDYKKCIETLRKRAASTTHDARNPVFRVLQILEHLRD
jgi:hypothetical protein